MRTKVKAIDQAAHEKTVSLLLVFAFPFFFSLSLTVILVGMLILDTKAKLA